MIYCDNSRRSVAEKCLRKRWWLYEYQGRGIQRVKQGRETFPLLTGTGVHSVIESVLQGNDIHTGICAGMAPYADFHADDERTEFLVSEQRALIEALGRAWHTICYQQFVDTYEVLAIEREETVELAPGLMWMSRPDLLVRRKVDGALFIVNMKTTKRADERWVGQWPIDQQTLSEVVAVEARIGEKLSGVIILGIIKGDQLEYPKGSGQWYHNNPLIWAWHNESGKAHPLGCWSARYEFQDSDGSLRRLGKGWVKREIWLHYDGGVAAWIEKLASADPAILHECVVQLPPIMRSDRQVEAWKAAVMAGELDIRAKREASGHEVWLDAAFPMSTSSGNCLWPTKCPCFALCHENADPDDESVWEPRRANHPQEELK